jgi:hypothetical protein
VREGQVRSGNCTGVNARYFDEGSLSMVVLKS